ncbi:carbohydrate-binding module family 13 protein [Backusella circina FSU 941]|nr:carbohydrate-binding module family 13 protein [Backusella circina FSU 941]
MTVPKSSFPLGYFYIISKLNGLAMDLRDPTNASVRAKVVMAAKKPESPERDSQLWIHQNGFLTNKSTGLVLDVNKAESFIAIFTGESRLYLDQMKEEESANDQRFGYESETGYIYTIFNDELVVDIRHEDVNEDARVMIYKKKPLEHASNQLWTIELADPPRVVEVDDEEDDSKRARLRAWFDNLKEDHKKREVVAEADLKEANQKVYKQKKAKISLYTYFSYELLAGAVAFEAVNLWEKKQEEEGKEVHHATAKKLIASLAAAELSKILQERGIEEEEGSDKRDLISKMTMSAATNYFESKHGA